RPRGDDAEEPGGREVTAIRGESLDRHRDQEHPVSGPRRSPVPGHHVRATLATMDCAPNPFGIGRIIASIRRLARPTRAKSGKFCVNDLEPEADQTGLSKGALCPDPIEGADSSVQQSFRAPPHIAPIPAPSVPAPTRS